MNSKSPLISIRQLAELLNATDVVMASGDQLVSVLTDSRSLASPLGTVFFALRTASGDGHLYIEELYERGVRTFIIEQPTHRWHAALPGANLIRASSTLLALQWLATWHRMQYQLPVVGITGSNGKTVVKEYLNTLLREQYRICRSPRSYNSQIGVPLSVLQLDENSMLGLFEAGISEPGEMGPLAQVIRPTIGVLTSLGSAHAEHFASQGALLAEKMVLLEGADKIVLPLDIPLLEGELTARELWPRVVGWSRQDPRATILLEGEELGEASTKLYIRVGADCLTLRLPMTDRASVENLLTTLCCVYALEGSLSDEVLDRVALIQTPEMRLEIRESYRGNTLINDAYSNDLDALRIALDVLRRRAGAVGAHAVAVLSDIEQSALPQSELYAEVARLLDEFDVHEVYAVGKQVGQLAQAGGTFRLSCYTSTDDLLLSGALHRLSASCILLKGARRYGFERIYRELSRLEHQTTLEVDLSAVRHNLAYFRSLLPGGQAVICMIKANGYGIGAFELAKTLEEARADYLAVAVADEGKQLRMGGIKSHIMVMNPDWGNMQTLFHYDLEPEVYSLDLLREVLRAVGSEASDSFAIHLKIDSGMHRLGLRYEELSEALILLRSSPSVKVSSVFSHLASADDATFDTFTEQQAAYLVEAHRYLCLGLGYRPMLHLLNTAGVVRFADRFAFDMVRLGLGLYGVNPVVGVSYLRPVCQLATTILQIKEVAEGQSVGYGCADILTRASRIAVVPIGYADGLRRNLGRGRWEMLVGDRLCPIVGNICMDTCMLDVTGVPEARVGTRVVVFGGAAHSLECMAEILDTIPYEILTTLSPRIQRLYYQD